MRISSALLVASLLVSPVAAQMMTTGAGKPPGAPSPSLAISCAGSGTPSSTIACTLTYTGTAPASATGAWNSTCTGSSTITSFTASGGTGSFTASTPSGACAGTLTVTSNVPTTATSGSVTISSGATFTLTGSTTVACAINGGTSATVTGLLTANTKLIVIDFSAVNSGTVTVADSSGNTYISDINTSDAGGFNHHVVHVISPTTTDSMTFSLTGTSIFLSGEVQAFTESGTPTVDVQTTATSTTSPVTAGPMTPSVSNALIVATIGDFNATETDKTIGGSFTRTNNINALSGTCFGSAAAYLQATSGAVSSVWTIVGTSANNLAAMLAFKP